MASLGILCLALGLVAAVSSAPSTGYTTKFDNVNLDQILKNDRLLTSYFNCLMDRGKCTPDGEELKKNIPDALATRCVKCSEKQKNGTEQVMKFLISKKPKLFDEFEQKYDPKGIYRERYRTEAEQHGITL